MKPFSLMSSFSLHEGVVHYHQTGARIRVDGGFVRDVATWLTYYVPLRVNAAARRLFKPGPRFFFTPSEPPPWYLVWNALAWIGARTAVRVQDADAIFYFEDATWGEGVAATGKRPSINGACTDASKSHVAAVFADVFGRPLALDPEHHSGKAVEKGEANGAHDGRIIICPASAEPGRVYQRLIETGRNDYVEDLRTPCVGGEPVLVFVKQRPKDDRFANYNTRVRLADPKDVFSADELASIRLFLRRMRLDWGGLDILRDGSSGEIYIVDVNKTDMPPLALPFWQKMAASRKLGLALQSLLAKAPTAAEDIPPAAEISVTQAQR